MIAAGAAQLREIGLREALILALERVGEVDVLEQTLRDQVANRQRRLATQRPHGVHGGHGHVVERLGAAGAEVEDAALVGMLEEPQVHGDHVIHEDEVA